MVKRKHLHPDVTPEDAAARYRSLRRRAGTQELVAGILQISTRTLIRRETGQSPITREVEFAMSYLVAMKKGR